MNRLVFALLLSVLGLAEPTTSTPPPNTTTAPPIFSSPHEKPVWPPSSGKVTAYVFQKYKKAGRTSSVYIQVWGRLTPDEWDFLEQAGHRSDFMEQHTSSAPSSGTSQVDDTDIDAFLQSLDFGEFSEDISDLTDSAQLENLWEQNLLFSTVRLVFFKERSTHDLVFARLTLNNGRRSLPCFFQLFGNLS